MAQTRVPFESLAQQRLRNVRRSSDDDQRPSLGGYVDVEGNIRGLIGDGVAPYQNITGRASLDGQTGLVAVNSGDTQRVATDIYGRLWTRDISEGLGASSDHSTAAAIQRTVYVGTCRVFMLRGITAPAVVTDRFVQAHDSDVAVVAGAAPKWEMLVPAATTVATQYAEAGDDFGPIRGLVFTAGLVLALSTTPGVFTAAGAEGFFQATYRTGT